MFNVLNSMFFLAIPEDIRVFIMANFDSIWPYGEHSPEYQFTINCI